MASPDPIWEKRQPSNKMFLAPVPGRPKQEPSGVSRKIRPEDLEEILSEVKKDTINNCLKCFPQEGHKSLLEVRQKISKLLKSLE